MNKIYKLNLHESLDDHTNGGNLYHVIRVPGGWVYRFFQFHTVSGGDGQWNENYVADSVFVPFNDEFEK